MIPKKIHYCWFGRGEKPELAKKCIKSWKKYCPNYEIIEWNEENFDINSNQYVKEAYENKKYAFVTDYVRLFVLYTQGGIYMDTDVEVIKPLDEYLHHEAVSGFENTTQIPTGLMACREGFPLFGELLHFYDDARFVNKDGSLNLTTNVETITNIVLRHGFVQNGQYQEIEGFAIYPSNIFCPEHSKLTDKIYMKDTATIHFFSGSWKSEKIRKREGSWWWKYIIVPLSRTSGMIEKIGGKPYKWVKRNVWRRIIQEKNNNQTIR